MVAQAAIKFDVDPVWAKELTDLPMAVPEYWWLGHTSRKRCFGKIKKVDCKAPNFAYFLLEVNGAPGQLYGMQYDDVLLYADNENPDYKKYTLPAAPPLHPKHEKSVTAKTRCGRPHQPKKATAAPVVTRPAKRGKKQQRRRKERGGTDNEASSSEEEGSAVPVLVVCLQLQFVFDTIQLQFVFDAIHTTLPSPDLRRRDLVTLQLLKSKRTRMTR